MILIALGANLSSRAGSPRKTCESALHDLLRHGVTVAQVSRWYTSAPVPPSDQPDYVNAVAAVTTGLPPEDLLATLLHVEAAYGRERGEANAARPLDLDLIAYHDETRDEAPILPHPRMINRAFVLLPLRDVAPGWRHPVTGQSIDDLIAALEAQDSAVPMA